MAEDAVKRLPDAGERSDLEETIAEAKIAASMPPRTAATVLTAQWDAYRKTKTDPDAGRELLFAVRDILNAQPDAFPVQ